MSLNKIKSLGGKAPPQELSKKMEEKNDYHILE